MVLYRRNRISGGTCFFYGVTLRDRKSAWLTRHTRLIARGRAEDKNCKTVCHWVGLPEHMHIMRTLPPGDTVYPGFRKFHPGYLLLN